MTMTPKKRLKQQERISALQKKCNQRWVQKCNIRTELINLAMSIHLLSAGYSDGDDYTNEDHLRESAIIAVERQIEQVAKSFVKATKRHEATSKELTKAHQAMYELCQACDGTCEDDEKASDN